jgi:hypothetical protein
MAYISCSLGVSLTDNYWYCNTHIMPLNVGWIYGLVLQYPHQNKWQVIEKNHENKIKTQFCCDSRCQGTIGTMVYNDGILKCVSFENVFLYTFNKTSIHYCGDHIWMLKKLKTMHHRPKWLRIAGKPIKSTSHIYVKHVPCVYFNCIMIVT